MSRSRALVTSSLEGAHASIHSSSSTSKETGRSWATAAAAPLRGLTNAGSRQRTSVSTRSAPGSARSWWRSGAIWVVSDHRAKRLSHGRGWPVTGSRSDVSWANSNSRSRSLVGCSDSSRRRPCTGSMTSCDRGWRPTRRMATPCAPIWSTILAWCAASTSCALRCSMTARYSGVRLCWTKHGVSRSPARIEASTVRRTSRALPGSAVRARSVLDIRTHSRVSSGCEAAQRSSRSCPASCGPGRRRSRLCRTTPQHADAQHHGGGDDPEPGPQRARGGGGELIPGARPAAAAGVAGRQEAPRDEGSRGERGRGPGNEVPAQVRPPLVRKLVLGPRHERNAVGEHLVERGQLAVPGAQHGPQVSPQLLVGWRPAKAGDEVGDDVLGPLDLPERDVPAAGAQPVDHVPEDRLDLEAACRVRPVVRLRAHRVNRLDEPAKSRTPHWPAARRPGSSPARRRCPVVPRRRSGARSARRGPAPPAS